MTCPCICETDYWNRCSYNWELPLGGYFSPWRDTEKWPLASTGRFRVPGAAVSNTELPGLGSSASARWMDGGCRGGLWRFGTGHAPVPWPELRCPGHGVPLCAFEEAAGLVDGKTWFVPGSCHWSKGKEDLKQPGVATERLRTAGWGSRWCGTPGAPGRGKAMSATVSDPNLPAASGSVLVPPGPQV